MATLAIGCAALVFGSWLILGAITVCSYLRDRPKASEAPPDDVMAIADVLRPAVPPQPRYTGAQADLLVDAFNWDRYETWLQDPAPKEMP